MKKVHCIFCDILIGIDYDTFDNIIVRCYACRVCIVYDYQSEFDITKLHLTEVVYYCLNDNISISVQPDRNLTFIRFIKENCYSRIDKAFLLPPTELKEKIKIYLCFQ